jgi:hypothetical protein
MTTRITTENITDGTIDTADLASSVPINTQWQSVQTTGFTAESGKGYPCNTTSGQITVTLPASPSVGDYVHIVDYAGTFDTNSLIIDPGASNLQGSSSNLQLSGEREGILLVYVDATQGWLPVSGINEGTLALEGVQYSVDYLVIGGGGSGGKSTPGWGGAGGAGGYRSSYNSETSGGGGSSESSLTFTGLNTYTITVGSGGAAGGPGTGGSNGSSSSIAGTGITTITSDGGGKGSDDQNTGGNSGASGGGGGQLNPGGSGTANQGYDGGDGAPGSGGGGGGAGAVGQDASYAVGGNGGAGQASTITGSSVTRAGGGGATGSTTGGTGSNGGGNGGTTNVGTATAGTANTGGGGGSPGESLTNGTNGGSGVVILRMATSNYSGNTTGSPTVTTDGSDTILTFTGSGSYIA